MINQGVNGRSRQNTIPPAIQFVPLKDWSKGVFSREDDTIPQDGLKIAENVELGVTGTIGPRPGLKLYGVQPVGIVLGQIYEFVKMNGTIAETWNIWMENRSGTGRVIISKDGGAHTVVNGKTYDPTAKAHFEQIFGKVTITNGVDNFSTMDIATFVITPTTALTQPGAPTVTGSAALISTPTVTLRYRIAAANQGETAAGAVTTVQVNKLREVWNGTTETVTVSGTRVANAQRYNIYVGDQAGFEYYLDSVADPGTGSTFTYTDTGAIAVTTTRIAPVGDSTAGPKTTRCTNIRGQLFMTGDVDNPGRIWFGSTTGGAALDFSSFNGGGYVEPNKGGKDFPVRVVPFRDGKGTPMAVCFSKGTNGAGKRYLLQALTTTLGETVISYLGVQEDNGQDGTDSPDGVVLTNDGAYYPSRSKFNTSNTRANIQNIISTTGISGNISDDVMTLTSASMDKCVGLVYDQRIYWTLPYSSTTNNQVWIVDLRNNGAWMRPWYMNLDWMWLYNDNTDGKTKFLALSNNQICEIDQATQTNDIGKTFSTNIGSGNIRFDKFGIDSASVIDVTFYFLRPQGNINMNVTADTEDGFIPFADTMNETSTQSVSGFGAYGWGSIGWGNLPAGGVGDYTVSASDAIKQWTLEIDEECAGISWGVNSTDAGVSYELAKVLIRYVPVGFIQRDN